MIVSGRQRGRKMSERTMTWQSTYHWAEQKPDAEALVSAEQRLTWAQTKQAVDRFAASLWAQGVRKGDRIAMMSAARPEFLIAMMATNRVGGIWLGINPKMTESEIQYLLEDSTPSVLIAARMFAGSDQAEKIRSIRGMSASLKHVFTIGEAFDDAISYDAATSDSVDPSALDALPPVSEDDDAVILYTSGSTGKPKGVVHTHKSLVTNAAMECELFPIQGHSRLLLHFPINHVAAVVEFGLAAIHGGACLVFMESFDPVACLKMIETERITMVGQIPAMFLLQFRTAEFSQTDFSSVERFIWAGAAAPRLMIDILGEIAAKVGARLVTGYGSTETAGFVTYTTQDETVDRLARSAGKMAPGWEMRIDAPVSARGDSPIGEVLVRGDFLFDRYWQNDEATRNAIDADGWFHTSDVGYLDERGYLYLTGRSSDMYKSGGENIFPREVEEVLETDEGVLMSAVVPVPDDIFQEIGWAYVMPKGDRQLVEAELRAHCVAHLANYKVPKRIFVLPMLPMLPNGKIDKKSLQAQALATLEAAQ
ncbi:class I adenylate-forming enzyme family protein [Microbacterium sp. H1-D42]|uniref:class I adenylate-forming enzyme family protein n=1 Tax=Microbacterium sp. H1-D42 TaxID=2925844 RepID=UPI001F534E29|nr:class I adenylate-forming enzyme family protein [Microbacterium sp. H1-D42]UNK72226.1 acyl--CoA ligase [Microbacterium sp. H1-D42]